MNYLNIFSSVAIFIFIISALPQIWKLFKNKTARDISLWMSVLITSGNFLMLVRAISISDFFFLINYAFQLTLWLTIIILILRYRDKQTDLLKKGNDLVPTNTDEVYQKNTFFFNQVFFVCYALFSKTLRICVLIFSL